MRILLSASTHHFDPERDERTNPLAGTSANVLARAFHSALSELGDLTYIGGSRGEIDALAGQSFDLFVGIDAGFSDVVERCDIGRSVYVAVNMHPVEKNDVIGGFARRAGVPRRAFTLDDSVDEGRIAASIEAADYVICEGNVATLNTYVRNGLRRDRIHLFPLGADDVELAARESPIPAYAFVAAQAGLRKGVDLLHDMFTSPEIADREFRLHVVGGVGSDFYREKLDDLQGQLGERMVVHGWLDVGSPEYRRLLTQCDFLVCPSLEEGTPGTVKEAVARGVTPIVSRNAGLDFSPLGHLELEPRSRRNVEVLLASLDLDADGRARLARQSFDYYRQFHACYREQIAELLGRIAAGESLYPKVSVVLRVASQQGPERRALELLHAACANYADVELLVTFDGCGEDAERAVREFFASAAPRYGVSFESTPGIGEVRADNLALRRATGDYCAILRESTLLRQTDALAEAVTFLERAPQCAILGGNGGRDFYPRALRAAEHDPGLVMTAQELYEPRDAQHDPKLAHRFFTVDAAGRGPLFVRRSFLEEHGYLDETYAPAYADDWDLCLRARGRGFDVWAVQLDVEDAGASAHTDGSLEDAVYRNGALFYSRWTFSAEKEHLWLSRTRLYGSPPRSRPRPAAPGARVLRRLLQPGASIRRRASAARLVRTAVNRSLAPFGLEVRRRRVPGRWRPGDGVADAWLDALQVGTVLDIGANEGHSALEFASRLPGVRIISFEPLADCFEKLSALRDVLPDFEAHNVALSDTAGTAIIHRSSFSPSSSLLPMGGLHKETFPWTAETTAEQIETARLDDLELDIRGNLVVKLDVQGLEDRVIAGGRRTIASAKAVIVEVTFKAGLYEGQASFGSVYRALTESGFDYAGNLWTVTDPADGAPLQGDALFVKAGT